MGACFHHNLSKVPQDYASLWSASSSVGEFFPKQYREYVYRQFQAQHCQNTDERREFVWSLKKLVCA